MRTFNTQDKQLIRDIHAYIGMAVTLYQGDHEKKGWTQEGLANDSGLSVSTVANLLHLPHKTYVPSSLTLAKLGKACGLMLVFSEPSKATLKLVKPKRKAS